MGTSSIDMIDIILIIVISAGGLSWLSLVLFGGNKNSRTTRPGHRRQGLVRPRAGSQSRSPSQLPPSGLSPVPTDPPPAAPEPPKENERLPLTWREVDEDILKELRQKVVALPTLPTLTTSLVAMLQDPETEPKEIAQIASTDPAVATEILRAVNSAYFALRQPCNDLDRAILLLGYNWVKFLVIRLGMHRSNSNDTEHTKRLGALWYHSFMTSECVTAVLRHYTQFQAAEASTAALLHDLGRLVKMDFLGAEGAVDPGLVFDSAGVPPEQRVFIEEDLFGVNHCVVGSLMGDHLNLPPLVKTVQAYHHHPLHAIWNLPQERDVIQVIAAVKLADMLAHAFNDQLNPQPQIMTGAMRMDPDLTEFRPFFPNLPSFAIVMETLDADLRKSHHFLEAFLPPSDDRKPHSSAGVGPTAEEAPPRRTAEKAPEEGHHNVGEIYYNSNPGPGKSVGWVCVEEGNPGLWRGFGKAPEEDQEQSEEHANLFPTESSPQATEAAPQSAPPIPPAPPSEAMEPNSPPPIPDESGISTMHQAEASGAAETKPDPARALFDEYVRQKMEHEEDISRLSFSRFKDSIEKTRASHQGNLQFHVAVRNGKVTLVAKKQKADAPPPLP